MPGSCPPRESIPRPPSAPPTSTTSFTVFKPRLSLLRRQCVPAPTSFDYAVLRIVPRVDREEFINAGVVLFCLEHRFLGARVHFDEERLRALWPEVDLDA